MNEKKAQVLEKLEESARVHDTSLRHSIDIAAHPEEHGWRKSLLTAMIVVPLTGLSAILTDINRILVSHSDDEAWDRSPPASGGASESRDQAPRSEERR